MASVKKFEELEVWMLSRELNKKVYDAVLIQFIDRHHPLSSQMDKSAGSVMDNIAEGFGRGGNKEFANFLSISKASANELRSQLYRALDRKIISPEQQQELNALIEIIIKKLGSFIAYLNTTGYKGIKYAQDPQVEYERLAPQNT